MVTGVEENVCDEPSVSPIAVPERMNFREPILKTCGYFYYWHLRVDGIP